MLRRPKSWPKIADTVGGDLTHACRYRICAQRGEIDVHTTSLLAAYR